MNVGNEANLNAVNRVAMGKTEIKKRVKAAMT
jgi:hypothetical protein